MVESKNSKPYDLGERTLGFARDVISLVNGLPKTMANVEVARQVIRSAGSVGANYIEANEAFGKKDFAFRFKICRKEAKETKFWLRLFEAKNKSVGAVESLIGEAEELTKIFNAIAEKSK